MVSRIRGLFLLDMIGDKDLNVARETGSSGWLQNFISQAANQLGYGHYFFQYETNIMMTTHHSYRLVFRRSMWLTPSMAVWT